MSHIITFKGRRQEVPGEAFQREVRALIGHLQILALTRPKAAIFALHWFNTWLRDWLIEEPEGGA